MSGRDARGNKDGGRNVSLDVGVDADADADVEKDGEEEVNVWATASRELMPSTLLLLKLKLVGNKGS